MRIAYVTETYPPEINGGEHLVERTLRSLRDHGHEVELIRPRRRGEVSSNTVNEWLTAAIALPMTTEHRWGFAFVRTLDKHFERTRPELVHIATQGPLGRAALLAARQRGLPVTTDFRTKLHSSGHDSRFRFLEPLIGGYLRGFHNRANLTFVPSSTVQRELAADGFRHLALVGRGVDTALFSPAKRNLHLRATWGAVQRDPPVLLYVGRLTHEKNVVLALRAFGIVHHLRPLTRMVVVGEGPLRPQLEAEFPAARFVGAQEGEALACYYASADLFIFPGENETFGDVTLEAMSSGLAVIAFNTGAAADHILHGINGMVVTPGDERAFMETVCRSAAIDRELVAPMGAQAREAALSATWDKVLGTFDSLLVSTAMAMPPKLSRQVAVA